MPSSKKSKEATWKEDELLKSLKAAEGKSSRARSSEKESSKHSDKERSKHRSKGEDSGDKGSSKSRSSRAEGKAENGDSRKHHSKEKDALKPEKESRSGGSSHDKDDRERRKHRDGSDRRDNGESGSRSRDSEKDDRKERTRDKDNIADVSSSKRSRDKDKDRDRERDKERDRDRDKDRDRDRDRDKDREKRKERDKERQKDDDRRTDRSRDRDRDKNREKERDGEKRRSKDKDRHKDRGTEREEDVDDRRRRDKHKKEVSRESRDKDREKSGRSGKREKDNTDSTDNHISTDAKESEKSRHRKRDKHRDTSDSVDGGVDGDSHRSDKRESRRKGHSRNSNIVDTDKLSLKPVYGDDDTIVNEEADKDPEKDEDIPDDVDYEATDDYDYGDDDFEDYDDDFEDEDNGGDVTGEENSIELEASGNKHDTQPVITLTPSELRGMEQLKQAIYEENERASSASRSPSRPSTMEGERGAYEDTLSASTNTLTPSTSTQSMSPLKGRINFVAAKQKQISNTVAKKAKRRGEELLKLLELDATTIHLFELAPTNEYELYMKNFGKADTTQIAVQTADDTYDGENQTDEIDLQTKWCQHSSEVQASGAGEDTEKKFDQGQPSSVVLSTNTVRLNNFLRKASTLCLSLLEEDVAAFKRKRDYFQATKTSFSDGYVQFGTNHAIIHGREIKSVSPPSADIDLVLTAYGPSHYTKENADLAAMGLICVWNPTEPEAPQRLLLCESFPTCCSFSPLRPSFVFAGMDDGSVVVWDLNESPVAHMKRRFRGKSSSLFYPTFTTASTLASENHQGPVVGLSILSQKQEKSETSSDNSSKVVRDGVGLSFQIATLDEQGYINTWIIVEVERPDMGGSEMDLGLSPGGKVKLMRTGSVSAGMSPRKTLSGDSFRATSLETRPSDPNHLYVGTNEGFIVHTVRFGERTSPRNYKSSSDPEFSHSVTTIDMSPWSIDYFLVGCDNGSLRLYNLHNELPLLEWKTFSKGAPYVKVHWSRSRPSAFFTLDASDRLSGWDLLQKDNEPLWQEQLNQGKKRLTKFTLAAGLVSSHEGESSQRDSMVLFYEGGSIEVHKLSNVFTKHDPTELSRFVTYLEETM